MNKQDYINTHIVGKYELESNLEIAKKIIALDRIDTLGANELFTELCKRANLVEEYKQSEGNAKTEVINKAAKILNVDIKHYPYYIAGVLQRYISIVNGELDEESDTDNGSEIARIHFDNEKTATEFYNSITTIIPKEDGNYTCYGAYIVKCVWNADCGFYEEEKVLASK